MSAPTIDDDVADVNASGLSPAAYHAFVRLTERARRYEYVLPLVTGVDSPVADQRTRIIAAGMVVGHDGDDLIRWAMEQRQ